MCIYKKPLQGTEFMTKKYLGARRKRTNSPVENRKRVSKKSFRLLKRRKKPLLRQSSTKLKKLLMKRLFSRLRSLLTRLSKKPENPARMAEDSSRRYRHFLPVSSEFIPQLKQLLKLQLKLPQMQQFPKRKMFSTRQLTTSVIFSA